MEIFLILLSLAIAIALIILTAKILVMKKAAKEIDDQFSKLIEGYQRFDSHILRRQRYARSCLLVKC